MICASLCLKRPGIHPSVHFQDLADLHPYKRVVRIETQILGDNRPKSPIPQDWNPGPPDQAGTQPALTISADYKKDAGYQIERDLLPHHGRPNPPDENEPESLARTIRDMKLRYVVITSVDRDDLRDGGAGHYVRCLSRIRELNPDIKLEVLVPDFRGKGRLERALEILETSPPDVFNHNLETVKPLYPNVRPGADYDWSLKLLKSFKAQHPDIPTKSGIMLGLGETVEQVEQVLKDLRANDVDMVTIGQYLQPTSHHHPVLRYWEPEEFEKLAKLGYEMGFTHIASGPLVRSSYHADLMAEESGLVA